MGKLKWTRNKGRKHFGNQFESLLPSRVLRFGFHESHNDGPEKRILSHMKSAHDGEFNRSCPACIELLQKVRAIMTDDKNKQPLENITINGKPLVVYVKEEEKKEVDEVREKEIRKMSAGTGYIAPQSKFGNISGKRSQYSNTTKQLSDEVRMHLNYLNEMGGMETVNDFLSKPQSQVGSIESVLKEHEEKVKFYLREQQRVQIELSRHQAVCDSLRSTLDILNGKATIPGVPEKRTTDRTVKRDWATILETCLADGPLNRRELREKMRVLAPDVKEQSFYTAIYTGIRRGTIVEKGDLIEWVPVEK